VSKPGWTARESSPSFSVKKRLRNKNNRDDLSPVTDCSGSPTFLDLSKYPKT
jgi:hypothetical protein